MTSLDTNTPPAEHGLLKHEWEFESRRLVLRGFLGSEEPAERIGAILAEYQGHPLGNEVCIEVDAGHIQSFDSSGIAMLVMLRHRLIDTGTWMRLVGASGKLVSVIQLLGLQNELGLHL